MPGLQNGKNGIRAHPFVPVELYSIHGTGRFKK